MSRLAGDSSRTGPAWVGLGSSVVVWGLFCDQLRVQGRVSPQPSPCCRQRSWSRERGWEGGTGSSSGTQGQPPPHTLPALVPWPCWALLPSRGCLGRWGDRGDVDPLGAPPAGRGHRWGPYAPATSSTRPTAGGCPGWGHAPPNHSGSPGAQDPAQVPLGAPRPGVPSPFPRTGPLGPPERHREPPGHALLTTPTIHHAHR